jgi:hypothetical protein
LEKSGLLFGEPVLGFILGNDDIMLHLPGQNNPLRLNSGQTTLLIMLICINSPSRRQPRHSGTKLSAAALARAEIEVGTLTSRTRSKTERSILLFLFISHTQY